MIFMPLSLWLKILGMIRMHKTYEYFSLKFLHHLVYVSACKLVLKTELHTLYLMWINFFVITANNLSYILFYHKNKLQFSEILLYSHLNRVNTNKVLSYFYWQNACNNSFCWYWQRQISVYWSFFLLFIYFTSYKENSGLLLVEKHFFTPFESRYNYLTNY